MSSLKIYWLRGYYVPDTVLETEDIIIRTTPQTHTETYTYIHTGITKNSVNQMCIPESWNLKKQVQI